jgi:Na+/H+-dicarboxylate symporter
LGVDRIPDMFRTTINLWSQTASAVLVDKWAGGGEVDAGESGETEPGSQATV